MVAGDVTDARQWESVLLQLVRVAPQATKAQYGEIARELLAELGSTERQWFALRGLQSYEMILVVESDGFGNVTGTATHELVKKVEPVFAVQRTDAPLPLFDEQFRRSNPIVNISFCKIHERLLLTLGECPARELVDKLTEMDNFTALRAIGWPDVIAVSYGDNIQALDDVTVHHLSEWPAANLACYNDARKNGTLSEFSDSIRPTEDQPLFSRTFTFTSICSDVVTDEGTVDAKIDGAVSRAQVRVYAPAGSAAAMSQARDTVDRHITAPGARVELMSVKGYEDYTILVEGLIEGDRKQDVPASQLLRAYFALDSIGEHLLSKRLDLLAPAVQPAEEGAPSLPPVSALPLSKLTTALPSALDQSSIDSGMRLILKRAYWLANRGLRNRVQFPVLMDIALHMRWFADELTKVLDSSSPDAPDWNNLRSRLAIETRVVREALCQRFHGDYYALFGDRASTVTDYPGGIQTVLLALWFLQWTVIGQMQHAPRSFWLVLENAEPAGFALGGQRFLVLPSSLMLALPRAFWYATHEIGHQIYALAFPEESETSGKASCVTLQGYLKACDVPGADDSELATKLQQHRTPSIVGHQWWDEDRYPKWYGTTVMLLEELFADAACLWGMLAGELTYAGCRELADPLLNRFNLPDTSIVTCCYRLWVAHYCARQIAEAYMEDGSPLEGLADMLPTTTLLDFDPGMSDAELLEDARKSWRKCYAELWGLCKPGNCTRDEWDERWEAVFDLARRADWFGRQMRNACIMLLGRALGIGVARLGFAMHHSYSDALHLRQSPQLKAALKFIRAMAKLREDGVEEDMGKCWPHLEELAHHAMLEIGRSVWPLLTAPAGDEAP